VQQYHDTCVDDRGYEGIMVRDPESRYENKRSRNLLKYKAFEDEEFVICGYAARRARAPPACVTRTQVPRG